MQFKDYYEALGVEARATDADIKSAYRRLARKYHPDVSKENGAEEKFKSVNEAYEALKDPARRKAYDQLRAGGYRAGDEFRPPPNWQREGDSDFGEGGGEDFSDFFESLFGRGGVRGPRARAARIAAATCMRRFRFRYRPRITAAASASACATAAAIARSTSTFRPASIRAGRCGSPGRAMPA